MKYEKPYEHRYPFLHTAVSNGQLVLRIRQATELGYIECESKGAFDMAYPNSVYRRSRVKEHGRVVGGLMSEEPMQHIFLEYDL